VDLYARKIGEASREAGHRAKYGAPGRMRWKNTSP
jgi:hypothetical protein